jgi:hypothetical protein
VKALLAACALLGGCAFLQPPPKPAETPLGPGEIRSAQLAHDAFAIGKITKADVRAALGEGVVVDFASGYEVWVYREHRQENSAEKPAAPSAELVLLFAPSGILTKTRIR